MTKRYISIFLFTILFLTKKSISQTGNFSSLSVNGKDEVGVSLPAVFANNVTGMNWKVNAVGSNNNNTEGRLVRLMQNSGALHFYDLGIDKQQSFFITEHSMPSNTPTFQKRIFVISPSNYVGINMKENNMPTATLHVDGNVRLENLSTGNGETVVVDANGYLYKKPTENNNISDVSKDINDLKIQIELLKKQNEEMAKQLDELKKKLPASPAIKK